MTIAEMFNPTLSPKASAFKAEATYGTVTHHFLEHQKDCETLMNPIASISALTCGPVQCGKLNNTPNVVTFTKELEHTCIDIVNKEGIMTKDLVLSRSRKDCEAWVTTKETVERRLQSSLKAHL